MAMKRCRECGQSVSSQAQRCPHCGALVHLFDPARFILLFILLAGGLVALMILTGFIGGLVGR
jgi:predicted amidophosphoribosyltransferase